MPCLFGDRPWLDVEALAARLGARATVLVDAAQTAFGHLHLAVPANGAVLSCPRKTLDLPDGAVLALHGVT
ncbi:MAG: hypothetical protein VW644_13150, partial [Alphaproteobacteria bacterium]